MSNLIASHPQAVAAICSVVVMIIDFMVATLHPNPNINSIIQLVRSLVVKRSENPDAKV